MKPTPHPSQEGSQERSTPKPCEEGELRANLPQSLRGGEPGEIHPNTSGEEP